MTSVVLLAGAASASAGDVVTLAEKTFRADLIVEARLVFDRPITKAWPNKAYLPTGMASPDALFGRTAAAEREPVHPARQVRTTARMRYNPMPSKSGVRS